MVGPPEVPSNPNCSVKSRVRYRPYLRKYMEGPHKQGYTPVTAAVSL